MKCVGAQNPPCARCSKVGRRCVVPPFNPGSRTISTHSSSESIKGLATQSKARPVVYPLTLVVDTRHDAPVSRHWEPTQGSSSMMQKILPSMPEMTVTRTHTPRPQTWDEVQQHPMSTIPIGWPCPSLQTPEMAPTHTQHILPTTTPAPDVVPVTPLQYPSAVPTQSSRRLPSTEELSHLCRL